MDSAQRVFRRAFPPGQPQLIPTLSGLGQCRRGPSRVAEAAPTEFALEVSMAPLSFSSRVTRRLAYYWGLTRLRHHSSARANAVAEAVRATRTRSHGAEAVAWFDRLEAVRNRMARSNEEISRMDYGAGSPNRPRSEAEMAAGVPVVDQLQNIVKVASKPPFWCRLLFELTRSLRPASSVELGTAVGMSAAYQTAALHLNGNGRLATLEGAATLAQIAGRNLAELGLDRGRVIVGRFQDTLDQVLTERAPVEFMFIDGHHDETATLSYFEQALPRLSASATVVFDDITWSAGMRRAWQAISANPAVGLAVDFGPVGLCLMGGNGAARGIWLPL